MSDLDKMMAFGHWLSLRKEQLNSELIQISTNATHSEAKIRVKAGHLESVTHVLEAFSDLYRDDLGKFKVQYLGHQPESEEESDGDR